MTKFLQMSALFAIICLTLFSCQPKLDATKVPGTWRVTSFTADLPGYSNDVIELGREEAISSIYTFEPNGKSHMISKAMHDGMSGTWSFDEGSNEIMMIYNGNDISGPEIYLVKSLEDSEMVWFKEYYGGIGTMEMVLTKQQE